MLIDQKLLPCTPQAIDPVVREWQLQHPACGVLILLPEAEQARIPNLQAIFRNSQIPLLGAVFPALVTDHGFVTEGAWLLCFDEMPPHFIVSGLLDEGGKKLGQAAQTILATEAPADNKAPTLFLIFDGMLPNIATLLNELHAAIGPNTNCTGVNAGSETFQPTACLFDSEKCLGEGVLGLLLDKDIRSTVKHGYPVSKSLMSATSTLGNRIDTLNHRPAFEVYQEVIKAEYGVDLSRDNFYDLAVHFPFGLITVLDVLVRIPVAVTDDGALFCVGEVPPNTLLKLLRAPDFADSTGVEQIHEAFNAVRPTSADRPLLTFYCAGRRMHFGPQAETELAQLEHRLQPATMFGALTLGEIDSTEELNLLPRFHNAAMVCLTF